MKYFKRSSCEERDDAESEHLRARKRGGYRLLRGTRALSVVFTLLATFIATNIAIFAANTYYNLDTGEIVVNEVQRVTNAIRATGGLIVGGTAIQDPTAGTEFEVIDKDSNGISARFYGRVVGVDAVNPTDFVTLQQLTSGSGGGVLNAFVQGGNAFGTAAILGTTDANDLEFIAGGGTAKFTVLNTDANGAVAEFSGRVRGVDAVNSDELVTLDQLNSIVAGSLTFNDNGFGFASYGAGTLALHEIDIIADTDLAAGTGLAFTGSTLGVTGVLEDLNTLGAPASDGQIIVATGAGTFAYESGATARASLGLTIGTDVQAYSPGLGQIAGLTDPNADRIMFWDDSANGYAFLEVTNGLSLSGTTLSVNSATEALAGIARFATQAEVNANTDMTSVVRPGTLGNWNGSTSLTTVGTVTNGTWQGTPIADAYIASASNWNTAFGWGNHAAAGYLEAANNLSDLANAGTARTNLGGTTVGQNFFTLTNPSAITFPRMNADNTVSALDAASFRTAIGAGTGNGSVTSVSGSGGTTGLTLTGGPITTTGTLTLGGTLNVANGGTGAATHTAGGVLFGNGTSAFTNSGVMANGQLLIGDGSGAPTVATLTEGTGITITNGAGSITIAADMGDLDGQYFAQGGNAFGAPAILGTNDAQSLSFETGGTTRVTIGASGGVTLASGNDFTVTSGTSNFGGDINLTGGNRTITTTGTNANLNLSANGTGTVRLASASTGNIEFFNNQNFIDSSGNLTIAGNFSLSGLTITNNGTLTTIASTSGDGLALDSATGVISIGDNQLLTDNGFDLTSGSIFREVHPIFGFDVPIRCSTACDGTYISISRAIENYQFPNAYAGTTRQHNFTIHYADTLSSGSSSWRVYNTTTLSTVDTFTVPYSPTNNLDSSAAIFTTGDVTIPTNGDDWVLQVSMPTGQTLQVNQVFLGAYDVIQ